MKPLGDSREAATVVDGVEIPEAEMIRGAPMAGAVFQVREAATVRQGRSRRRSGEEIPEPSFQVREAVTTTLPPPHWAKLVEEAGLKPVDGQTVSWESPPEAEDAPAPPVGRASPPANLKELAPKPEPAPAAQVGQASAPADLKEE